MPRVSKKGKIIKLLKTINAQTEGKKECSDSEASISSIFDLTDSEDNISSSTSLYSSSGSSSSSSTSSSSSITLSDMDDSILLKMVLFLMFSQTKTLRKGKVVPKS